MSAPVVDISGKTVTYEGTAYVFRPLADDTFTVLVDGVPVGRAVYSFGAANGVVEGSSVTEETLTLLAEAWFAALDA